MAPKGKAKASPAEEPAVKKAKTEEAKEEPVKAESEEKEAESKAPEGSKEQEKDASPDKRTPIKETVSFPPAETTLNLMPASGGKLLTTLSDGGTQYLLAGGRVNAGMMGGRYMFEVKVVEALTPAEGQHRGRTPLPRQLVRVGVSTAGSSLLLGDAEGSAYFDSEGFFTCGPKRVATSQRFGREQVVAVVINLDQKSPNANTISLFRAGERIALPQALPDTMKGKPLFPHVTFRNVSLLVNFGPAPLKPLPFKCRTLQEAASADIKLNKIETPKGGKHDVVFPVGLPDEGTFNWLDTFLEKNPSYLELSDRMILDWAAKSGLWKHKSTSMMNSNDKPDFNFGLPLMEDGSIRRALFSMASVMPRNYVVMEVRSNLMPNERKERLKQFTSPCFKRRALVVMGEPTKEAKEAVQKNILEEKQAKAEAEWKLQREEARRKKLLEQRQKEITEKHKQALEAMTKKKEEEEASKKKAEGKEESEAKKEEVKDEEAKAETKDEEMKAAEEDDEEEGTPPEVELTEEEKKLWFKPNVTTDLPAPMLNAMFPRFALPEKEEGFDAVDFEWQDKDASEEYLKKWIQEKKCTSRIEDLQPGEFFKERLTEWQKVNKDWQTKQREHKEKGGLAGKKEGEEEDDEESAAANVDIFSLEDVCDIGTGEPLFANFGFEDWALFALRYELYLLVEAFRRDVNDPDRPGIHESHLLFYYSRYYKKQLNPKLYGKETIADLIDMVKDTVSVSDKNVLTSQLSSQTESVDIFVKLTEEGRRERQRRIDAGDDNARLKFSTLVQQQQQHGLPGTTLAPMLQPPSATATALLAPRPVTPTPPLAPQAAKALGKGGFTWQAPIRSPYGKGKK